MEDSVLLPSLLSDPTILVPKIGQTFDEDSDGYAFYNLYARFTGFGIRRSKNRFKDGGVKSMQEFCCIREVKSLQFFRELHGFVISLDFVVCRMSYVGTLIDRFSHNKVFP